MPVQVSRQHQPQPHHSNHSSSASLTSPPVSTNTTAASYSLHRGSPTSSRDDASSASSLSIGKRAMEKADGRQRKRLPKNTDPTSLPRNPSLRSSPAKPPIAPRSSLRDQKNSLVAKAPDFSSLKPENHLQVGRPFAASSSSSSSTFTSTHTQASPSEPPRRHRNSVETDHSNVTTFYAFGQTRLKGEGVLDDPFDFQPSMNLEDVHRGITHNEQINSFPSPSRKAVAAPVRAGIPHSTDAIRNRDIAAAAAQSSMLRRPSVNKFSQPQNREPREPPARRRTSNVSNLTISTSNSSSYRKSMTTTEPENSIGGPRRKPSGAPGSLGPPVPPKYYRSGGYPEAASEGGVKIPLYARSTKSKSLQPPPRQAQNPPLKTSLTPDQYRASVGLPPRSPRSPSTGKKLSAPSSTASRRISTIPHASGLAARTISPTDARRLKRLSMLNTPPPPSLPHPPETARSMPGSPAMVPMNSVTPSSQATTPEPQRKSYSSGLSISSASTSARTSVSLQPKLALNIGSSRLPRPPQLERDDEDIPPVPPLPKNLASPAEPHSGESSIAPSYDNTPVGTYKSSNGSSFGPRKSSLAPETSGNAQASDQRRSIESDQTERSDSVGRAKSSSSTLFNPRKSSLALEPTDSLDEPVIFDFEPANVAPEVEVPQKPEKGREPRRKRGMTMGGLGAGGNAFHMLESKTSSSSLRKKDLVPIRLPPLNLLPLSTPTIARVNALAPDSTSDSEGLTPPPKKGHNKTPATPMTASKATFFGRRSGTSSTAYHERSKSSFNHSMQKGDSPSSLSIRAGSSTSSSIPISASSRMGRQTISPYVTSSLPRGVSANETHGKATEQRRTVTTQPRDKSRTRKSDDSLKAPEDSADPPSTSSSIRRKLSLSWKKTSQGKNSHAATERAEEYGQGSGSKFDTMPPPRLPTSSTWTPGTTKTPSPTKGPYLSSQVRRKSSPGSNPSLNQHDRTKSDGCGIMGSPKKEKKPEEKPLAPLSKASATSSMFSPMSKMLGSKGSLSQLRSSRNQPPPPPYCTDPTLDHDDLIAEEEIRKIASKRKNLDQAAAQLDELKRRAGPKERLSPQLVLRMGCLNIFEKGEIVDYKDVYFTGLPDAKKHVGDLKNSSLPNFGYDDDRGDYTIVKGDHLSYRYEIIDILGKGSFGQVVRCIDHRTGGLVAIKIIRNKKRFHQQALVEVNILQKLKEWDPQQKHSLINFTQSFYFRGHLCISTELLGMNLYEFIKSNDFRGFSLKLIRRFTKQMLSSLILLKGHRVIHCDLKPENILLAHPAHTEIKVIDFGSSCFENEKVYTYIQSRFYRSPEVILGMSYGLSIDMWSLGCILAELYTGYPIFPGENEQEQLACIMEVFGPPEKHLIEKSTRRKLFFDSQGKPRMIVSTKGRRRRVSSKTLQNTLKCDDEPFLDFVSRCLRWDPEKRLRPEDAMNHEFITGRKPVQPSHRARSGNYASATASSDTRRYTAYSRPLPDPPVVKKPVVANISPIKSSTTSSTIGPSTSLRGKNPTLASTSKRSSNGTVTSTLPRVAAVAASGATHRSISGKMPYTNNTTGSNSGTGIVGGRSSAMRTGTGTSGSIRLLRDEEAAMSSGGEGRKR